MDNRSYWDSIFKNKSDLIIMYLMGKLDIDQLDFDPTDLVSDKKIYIGRMNNNTFRISILDENTKIISGDCEL